MKKALFILFVTLVTFTSCKKDPEEKLEGRWDLTKVYNVARLNGTITSENTENYAIGESYIVFEENNYKSYSDGTLDDQGSFTATENAITITDEDGDTETIPMRWNSKNEFVIVEESSDNSTGSNYKSEATFKKN